MVYYGVKEKIRMDTTTKTVTLQVELPVTVVKEMRLRSKELGGVKRPHKGSAAHFARMVILERMKEK